jgi:hypothetical protein
MYVCVPAAHTHVAHCPPDILYLPALQYVQELSLPNSVVQSPVQGVHSVLLSLVYVLVVASPGLQTLGVRQDVCPVLSWYFPSGQEVHDVPVPALYDPAKQFSHWILAVPPHTLVRPWPAGHVSALHGLHVG